MSKPISQSLSLSADPVCGDVGALAFSEVLTRRMTIAFGVDRNFCPHLAATIASIVQHTPDRALTFFILHSGVEAALRERVEVVAPGARFLWLEVTDGDVPEFADNRHFTRATLFRLGLERLAPADCRRVLYLDSDLTVLGDVRHLYRMDLKGEPLAAAVDAFIDPVAFAARWELAQGSEYFNAGVLVIDLERVRAERLFSKAAAFMARHNPPFNDQDALNWACWGRWTRFDVTWNAQRHMAIPSLIAGLSQDKRLNGRPPQVIHFTGPEKPWIAGVYHPWSWLYWESLARTPFLDEVARSHSVSRAHRLRLWLRWVRRGAMVRPAVRRLFPGLGAFRPAGTAV
jgi:lipopolysaccharide biosynthesis glycosyltransferase